MKTILWLCNNPTPQAAIAFGWSTLPVGGWMVWLSERFGGSSKYHLCLAFPHNEATKILKADNKGVSYFAVPNITNKNWKYCQPYEDKFIELINMVNPDIVHIWGTEYQHSLAMASACQRKGIIKKCVVSIQGLVNVYAKYYFGNLSKKESSVRTLRDIIKRDTLKIRQRQFVERGQFEIACLNKVAHIIGRTDWDKALTLQINPHAKYHFNNENLRDRFYDNIWTLENCIPHQIFVSQAQYPIKGLDVLLKALPEVLKYYPDTKVIVAGAKIISDCWYKRTSYGKILSEYIYKHNLKNHIEFIGMCDEYRMVDEFKKANVFVCPSAIENSPNSVGEAMILGVPVVASYVGGTECLLTHGEDGFLYQSDADYMLAYYIKKIFGSSDLASKFSLTARQHALNTHNRELNYEELIHIYEEIMEENVSV